MALVSLNDFVSVPISTGLYHKIALRYPERVSSLIEDVVQDFLERTAEDLSRKKTTCVNGINWDPVFLPDKTRIRTKYFGQYRYAEIKSDAIIYNTSKVSSISRLARRMRDNTSVNAWNHIEIQRPGDKEWIKADLLRRGA